MDESKEHREVCDKLQELGDVSRQIKESTQSLVDGISHFKQLAIEAMEAIGKYKDARYKELQALHDLIRATRTSSVPRDSINDGDLYRLMDFKDIK